MRPLKGIFPALITPFVDDQPELSQLRSNIEMYEKIDLGGYLVLGSTGEAILLSENEQISLIKTVVESAGKEKVIISGTGRQSTKDTIAFSNKAAVVGAEYALVVTPYYYKGRMDSSALVDFYTEVADNSTIPVLIYNVPKFTSLDIPLDVVVTLSAHPNIAGIKESSGNFTLYYQLLDKCSPDFAILTGAATLLYPSVLAGGAGGVLALGNIAPKELVDIYKLALAGELEKAQKLQFNLLDVNQTIVGKMGIPGIKYAIEMLGFRAGLPRSPLKEASKAEKDLIELRLRNAGLLA